MTEPRMEGLDKFIGGMNKDSADMVPGGGIEPPTLRFSVACSTN